MLFKLKLFNEQFFPLVLSITGYAVESVPNVSLLSLRVEILQYGHSSNSHLSPLSSSAVWFSYFAKYNLDYFLT